MSAGARCVGGRTMLSGTADSNRQSPRPERGALPLGQSPVASGPREIRTPYLYNANVALYQMSYGPVCGGGPDGIRTHCLHNAIVALCQMSYRPTWL